MSDSTFIGGLCVFEAALDVDDGVARYVLRVWSVGWREQALEVLRLDYRSEQQFCEREGRLQYFLCAGTSMGCQLLETLNSAWLVMENGNITGPMPRVSG